MIFALIFGWIFGGWPRIWNNPRIPPEVPKVYAAVARDAVSESHNSTTGSTNQTSFSWSHAGAASGVSGVLVFVLQANNTGDDAISVTYGGSSLSKVSGGMAADTTGESGMVTAWFLGSSIPQGTQTVVVNRTNNGDVMYAVAITVTASVDTQIAGTPVLLQNDGTYAEQNVNSGTATAIRFAGGYSGGNSVLTAGANSTSYGTAASIDFGAYTYTTAYETTGGSGSRPVGFTYNTSDDRAAVHLAISEVTVTAPTVTLSAATSVEDTTATLNGNVTATGGENPTVTVYWGTTDGGQVPGNWANNSAPTSPSQPQGAAAFYKDATSLPSGTTIYFSAKATNSGGTGWPAASLSFLTKPAAPTNVVASDNLTDRVTVSWTQSTGATNYRVYRDSSDISGLLGNVATWDDTTAAAPTITAGTAAASDGTSADYVVLSLAGESANNGTTYTYYVVAINATGASANSSTDTGHTAPGALTYQWQRTSTNEDIPANYSNISGATTDPYNDTGAPSDGSIRYFRAVLNATGASQQISTTDSGYRYTNTATTFLIGGSEAGTKDTAVTTITFPQAAPGATVDAPYNDVDGSGDPQVLSPTVSEPVVKIKNTHASTTYYIVLEISTWTNGIADMEYYNLASDGATNIQTVVNELSNANGAARTVSTGVSIAPGAYKDLYLKLVLSSAAAKTGTSTLTILGETP